jgi:hypothetical protein
MESPLQHLIGQILLRITGCEGELGLEFSAAKVAVFNPVSGSSPETCVGATVQVLLYIEHDSWRIEFSNGQALSVSLRAKDFSGPEAFCVTFANGAIVVAP